MKHLEIMLISDFFYYTFSDNNIQIYEYLKIVFLMTFYDTRIYFRTFGWAKMENHIPSSWAIDKRMWTNQCKMFFMILVYGYGCSRGLQLGDLYTINFLLNTNIAVLYNHGRNENAKINLKLNNWISISRIIRTFSTIRGQTAMDWNQLQINCRIYHIIRSWKTIPIKRKSEN